jgi:DNA mismatch repair protein MSH5
MISASELYGELDSLMALAMAAVQYHWTAPEMTVSNIIDIREGRHPLQELVVPAFIANPCRISGGAGVEDDEDLLMPDAQGLGSSMLIMTGPNHSGKSVYLKQVALIVFLAHVGSYVPADHAVIGLTDKILTRISTRESMARSESAFAIDLRQAAFAINHVTHRSLVLIDEFGKGTNPNDGAGLMTALLAHFRGLEDARPKVLVATHFHEIFENGFLSEDDEHLAFAHMDVRADFGAIDPDDQVIYLFRVMHGLSTSSFGTQCAARNGVDRAVVERAEDLTLMLARNEDLRTACAKLAPAEERRLEEAEGIARLFVEMDVPEPRQLRAGGPSVREMLAVLLGIEGSS